MSDVFATMLLICFVILLFYAFNKKSELKGLREHCVRQDVKEIQKEYPGFEVSFCENPKFYVVALVNGQKRLFFKPNEATGSALQRAWVAEGGKAILSILGDIPHVDRPSIRVVLGLT